MENEKEAKPRHKYDDSFEARFKMFEVAKQKRLYKENLLQQGYRYAFPDENNWFVVSPGQDRTIMRWDITAIEALSVFASNVQTYYANPYKKLFRLKPGPKIKAPVEGLQEVLDAASEICYNITQASNFTMEANLSIKECGVSTGLLQIKDSIDYHCPIKYESIPMYQAYVMQYGSTIKNIWRKYQIPAEEILSYWPAAELTDSIKRKMKENKRIPIDLVESTIYYPLNPKNERYIYTVDDVEGKKKIFQSKKKYSDWIPFRWAAVPGEDWGTGPVLSCLDYIRMANSLAMYEMNSAGFQASRPLMVNTMELANPNMIAMRPGAIIQIKDTMRPPLIPLDVGGNIQLTQVSLERIQQVIRDMMYADPIINDGSDKTATEVKILQENWIRKSASSFWRFQREFGVPHAEVQLLKLEEKGLLPKMATPYGPLSYDVTDGMIAIEIISPLFESAKRDEVRNFQECYAAVSTIEPPPNNLLTFNVPQITPYICEKFDIDQKMYKSVIENKQTDKKMQQNFANIAQQAQQQSPNQEQQPLSVSE